MVVQLFCATIKNFSLYSLFAFGLGCSIVEMFSLSVALDSRDVIIVCLLQSDDSLEHIEHIHSG